MQNAYSIVVIGQMNPAIHHPYWYKDAMGALSEDEFHVALSGALTLPQLSQFKTPTFQIRCTNSRWDAQVSDESNFPRIVDLACRAFEVLDHTPVRAFGFNFDVQLETELDDVGATLASRVASMPLGLEAVEKCTAAISWHEEHNTVIHRLVIEPIAEVPKAIAIKANVHVDVATLGIVGRFDFGALLRQHLPLARDWARTRAIQVQSALNPQGGTHGSRDET